MKFKQVYRLVSDRLFFYPLDDEAFEFLNIFTNSRGGARKSLTEEQVSFLSDIGVNIKISKPLGEQNG